MRHRLHILLALFGLCLSNPAAAATLNIGDAVEVLWNGNWWPATLERLQDSRYCITYDGFDRSWDECVPTDRIRPAATTPEAITQRQYQIGFQHLINRQYVQAIGQLRQSLQTAAEAKLTGQDSLIIQERALNALSTAYAIVGDFDRLQTAAEQHLQVAEQLQDPAGASAALTRLGSAYFYRGDFDSALRYHQQAIARAARLAPATQKFAIIALAETYLAQYQPQAALSLLKPLEATAKDPEQRVALLQTLGLAYAMVQDHSQAIAQFQAAIALTEANPGLLDISLLGNGVNNLAYTLYQSGDVAQAETQLRRAIALWERQRSPIAADSLFKVSLLEAQLLSYGSLQKVLMEQNQPEAALEISEQGRAQIFLEQVTERLSPETAQRLKTEPITIARIRALAKAQNTTLVEYSLVDTAPRFSLPGRVAATELFIWVVKPTGEVIQRTVDLRNRPQSLETLIFKARQAIGAGGRASIKPVAGDRPQATAQLQQLYDLLIAPIAADLPQQPEAKVTFIPQRELFLVPFPALITPTGESLIDRHTILTAPSIQSLEQAREQIGRSPHPPGQPLIVGNPTMPTVLTQASATPATLSPLAGAEAEAKAIAKLLNSSALTGSQATRAAVLAQMPQASIIHLATHGLLDDFQGVGLPGAIALAPDGTGAVNDGLVTAGDLLEPGLRLRAELVVLSACDTGRGRVTGDGVLGLARSLAIAGAPDVMVSLWKVPDRATAELMEAFYRNWRGQGMDKAQALRQAMLAVKRAEADSLAWAGFTMIGAGD